MTEISSTLTKPSHVVVGATSAYPSGLKSAALIATEVGVAAERLEELARTGWAPHWRIDNGPPMFKLSELKLWIVDNLIERFNGMSFPSSPLRIVAPSRIDMRNLPYALREMSNLHEIGADVFRSGVYFLTRKHDITYIGQSVDVHARIGSHHASNRQFDRAFFLPLPKEDLSRFEGALIRHFRPPENGPPPDGWGKRRCDDRTCNEFRYLAIGDSVVTSVEGIFD